MKSLLLQLILGLVTAGVVSSAIAQPASAECSQPVKIIVSYPPGSPDDVIARLLAQKLSEAGGRFYVENLPGAAGMIGTATAARALPDGCTMVIVNQNFVVQPAIGEKLALRSSRQFYARLAFGRGAGNHFGQPVRACDHHQGTCRAGEGEPRQV